MKDRAEGSPSVDENRDAWIVYNGNESILGIVSCDISANTILGSLPVGQFPNAGFLDSVTMSPTKYEGAYLFNAATTNRRPLFTKSEHSDIGIGLNGKDVYVWIDFDTPGWLTPIDLSTNPGARTLIFDLFDQANSSINLSGKGIQQTTDWVIASTYSCKVTFAWSCFKVMAVELVPNGRVLSLAHAYTCGDHYWAETYAAVNRDSTRVYYNSDGQSCGRDARVYICGCAKVANNSSGHTQQDAV